MDQVGLVRLLNIAEEYVISDRAITKGHIWYRKRWSYCGRNELYLFLRTRYRKSRHRLPQVMCSLVSQDEGSSKPLIRLHKMTPLTFLVRTELKRMEKGVRRGRRRQRGGTGSTKGTDIQSKIVKVYLICRSRKDTCVFSE